MNVILCAENVKTKNPFLHESDYRFSLPKRLEYDVVENYKYKIGKIWSDFSTHKFPAGLIENEFLKKIKKNLQDYVLMSDRSILVLKFHLPKKKKIPGICGRGKGNSQQNICLRKRHAITKVKMFNSLPFLIFLIICMDVSILQYNIPVTSNFRSEHVLLWKVYEGAKIQITLQRTASWA